MKFKQSVELLSDFRYTVAFTILRFIESPTIKIVRCEQIHKAPGSHPSDMFTSDKLDAIKLFVVVGASISVRVPRTHADITRKDAPYQSVSPESFYALLAASSDRTRHYRLRRGNLREKSRLGENRHAGALFLIDDNSVELKWTNR